MRQLAERWGFTYSGAAYHAKNLDLITQQDENALDRSPKLVSPQFERDVQRRTPGESGFEGEVTELVNGLLSDRVIAAVKRELISVGRAREILSMR